MNVITDYFVPPNRKKRRKSKNNETQKKETDESDISDLDGKFVDYKTRKIRIRLADPNIRDSYLCEVYDTSVDEDVDEPFSDKEPAEKSDIVVADAFKIMMASMCKESRPTRGTKRDRLTVNKKQLVGDRDSSSDDSVFVARKKIKSVHDEHKDISANSSSQEICPTTDNNSFVVSKTRISVNAKKRKGKPRKKNSNEVIGKSFQNLRNDQNTSSNIERVPLRENLDNVEQDLKNIIHGRVEDKATSVSSYEETSSKEFESTDITSLNEVSSLCMVAELNSSKIFEVGVKNKKTRRRSTRISNESTESMIDTVSLKQGSSTNVLSELVEENSNVLENKKSRRSRVSTMSTLEEVEDVKRNRSCDDEQSEIMSSKSVTNSSINGTINVTMNKRRSCEKTPSKSEEINTSRMSRRSLSKSNSKIDANNTPSETRKINVTSEIEGRELRVRRSSTRNEQQASPREITPRKKVDDIQTESKSNNITDYFLRKSNKPSPRSKPDENNDRSGEILCSPFKYKDVLKVYIDPLVHRNINLETDCVIVLNKVNVTPGKIDVKTIEKSLSPESDCAVVLEKVTKKLAPLFLKKNKKSDVDPETLKARKQFLNSGLPSKVRKKAELLNALTDVEVPFFPTISHVQQRCDKPLWGQRDVNISLLPLPTFTDSRTSWKYAINVEPKKILKENKKSKKDPINLEKLRNSYKNIPIDALYTSIKASHDDHAKKRQKRKKPKKAKNSIDGDDTPMWTQKYQPQSINILSNNYVLAKLTEWLRHWKNYDDALRAGNFQENKKNKHSDNDDDDFITSDEDESTIRAPRTACLLSGPPSSGKTALIQALATEIDFNILEINASSKRTGKKILADLQEATQSHKVSLESNNFFGSSSKTTSNEKISMIVVEDADIVFENQDDGFIQALQTLINTAKRPVFLLTSDSSVKMLDRFRTKHTIQLEMKRPLAAAACAILELISLVEGIQAPRSALLKLVGRNNNDLRQCILELQFWLRLNREGRNDDAWSIMTSEPLTPERVWWGSHRYLYKEPLWHSGKKHDGDDTCQIIETTSKVEKPISKEENKSRLDGLVRYLDGLSVSDVFRNSKNKMCDLNPTKFQIKDSLSLEDDRSTCNWNENQLRDDIAEDVLIRCATLHAGKEADCATDQRPIQETRWLQSRISAMEELLTIRSITTSHRISYVDYLPTLRSICRSENERMNYNSKRRNRFYHYLKSLGANPTESNLDINREALFSQFPGEASVN